MSSTNASENSYKERNRTQGIGDIRHGKSPSAEVFFLMSASTRLVARRLREIKGQHTFGHYVDTDQPSLLPELPSSSGKWQNEA